MNVSNVVNNFLALLYHLFAGIFWLFIPNSYKYKDVSKEKVLITGAGSGLGRLLAIKFAKLGSTVILWDINESALKSTCQLISSYNGTVFSYVCDVSSREEIYKTAYKVKSEVGDVTLLINNAGIVNGKCFMECDDKKIIQLLNVNLISQMWTCKAFLPYMMSTNHGHIVFIASIAGFVGAPRLTDYCVSKYGAVGFEESLRFELKTEGYSGVHTSVVCPWFMSTGMFDGAKSLIPFLDPEYVADVVVDGIRCNTEMILLPRYMYLLFIFKTIIPTEAAYYLLKLLKGDVSMKTFTGRTQTIKVD